jgi:hypothetical protein
VRGVEPAQHGHGTADGGGDGGQVGDVGRDRLGALSQLPNRSRGLFQAGGVDVDQGHGRARGGEGERAGPADARGRAGDQRGPP